MTECAVAVEVFEGDKEENWGISKQGEPDKLNGG